MKKILGIPLVLTTALLMTACSTDDTQTDSSSSSEISSSTTTTDSSSVNSSSTLETETSTADSEGSTPAIELGTKENPAPLGQPLNFQFNFTDQNEALQSAMLSINLTNIAAGEEAYYQMHDLDPSNPNVPEGQEWLLFEVTIMMNAEDAAAQVTLENTFSIENAEGQLIEQTLSPNMAEQALQTSILSNGAMVSGKFALMHPVGDASTIVFIAPDGTTQAYWHL
ncbi:hypothetical protein [Enterococcus sp. LJL90]